MICDLDGNGESDVLKKPTFPHPGTSPYYLDRKADTQRPFHRQVVKALNHPYFFQKKEGEIGTWAIQWILSCTVM